MPVFTFATDAGLGIAAAPRIATMDLATVEDARVEAVRYLGELLREDGIQFWRYEQGRMRVADQDGRHQFTLTLSVGTGA